MKKTTGVLLVNLGTPDSPKLRDVYRYLIEFLCDNRVIDIPWLSRQLLVRGFIVPTRYRQSARSYKAIWTSEGSPLKVFGYRVQKSLQEKLGENFHVELAMRYRSPSLEEALERLKNLSLSRLVVFPFFPQYASATTGSVQQKFFELVSRWQVIPEIHFINHYATDPQLISAFKAVAEPYDFANYDHFLFSFHGLPQRQILKANPNGSCLKIRECCHCLSEGNHDCYSAQCYATAFAMAKALSLPVSRFSISFQSRLGKEPWLQPYTGEVISNLAHQGKKRLLVFCPAFVCDCLETIYEIGVEYKTEFKHAGGECLDLVPGLNDHPQWIEALAKMIRGRLPNESRGEDEYSTSLSCY